MSSLCALYFVMQNMARTAKPYHLEWLGIIWMVGLYIRFGFTFFAWLLDQNTGFYSPFHSRPGFFNMRIFQAVASAFLAIIFSVRGFVFAEIGGSSIFIFGGISPLFGPRCFDILEPSRFVALTITILTGKVKPARSILIPVEQMLRLIVPAYTAFKSLKSHVAQHIQAYGWSQSYA